MALLGVLLFTAAFAQSAALSAPGGVSSVSGTVRNASGAANGGASVVLAPMDHSLAAISTRATGDGGFRFDAVPPGSYSVCATSPDRSSRQCVENVVLKSGRDEAVETITLTPAVPSSAETAPTAAANTGRTLGAAGGQARPQSSVSSAPGPPTRDDLLRGGYGPYRANNDLLSYTLDVRVDPAAKTIVGKNTVRFRMLANGKRIQLDLVPALNVDRILLIDEKGRESGSALHYTRDERAVFIDLPKTLHQGNVYAIDFFYSGHPFEGGRFGGMAFKTDPAGRPWIYTACEEEGASVWWPNKDQWRDEVEFMDIRVAVPNGLVDVSNGKFAGKTDLGDGYTRWDWHVSYPINNYDVALNIGDYVHFGDIHRGLALDFYVLPENLEKAKKQFAQVPAMLDAYQHYFGEYPFERDGYKLVEVPYAGMEHQSAVAYGNRYANGYLERDWTGVGISPRFDFIIIHESGHEWFGNAITAADRSDMWIHEGWTTYLECLYVEYMWGHEDEVAYVNALKKKVRNNGPIIPASGQNREPPQDQYFKGALFINTLRIVVNDDAQWFAIIHDFFQAFKYKTIGTDDVIAFFTRRMGIDVAPIFGEYLRHTEIPVLELRTNQAAGTVDYRWKAEEPGFAMPLVIDGRKIRPTAEWQTMSASIKPDEFKALETSYYIEVKEL